MPGFRPRRFLRDDGGAISIIAALSLFMLLAVAAIVIDVGSLYFQRRNLQAVDDAAALAAVQNPANALAVATDVFTRNGYSDETLTVTTGVYTADETLSAAARFTPGSGGVNAVRISARRSQSNYLAVIFGLSHSTLAVVSTAARLPTVSFGAGTRLVSLDNGLANAVLGQMIGSGVALQGIDYDSLLNTNIDALTFLKNLAIQAGVSGSYSQLAASNVTMGQLLEAMVETANAPDEEPAAASLKNLQNQTVNTTQIPVSQIMDLSSLNGRNIGDVGEVDGTGAQFNVMSLLSASARTVASGQLVNLIANYQDPITGAAITAKLAVGAPFAQVSDAQVGVSIRTAQIRMAIIATVAKLNLGVSGATNVTIQVPIYLEAAYGQATVTALPCTVGGTLADIAATSGATSVQFGSVTDAKLKDFSTPVTPGPAAILNASLSVSPLLTVPIQVNASGTSTIASSGPTTLPFTQADIDAGTVKSAPSGSATPFNTLSSNLTLNTSILGSVGLLGATLNSLLSTLTGSLKPIAANLTGQLDAPVSELLTTLGITLGIIDVRVFGASCRTPVLVG